MLRHKTLILAPLMVCLAIMPLDSTNVLAQGIPEVIQRLNNIQQTLNDQIIPKLDQCTQCPECPECKTGVAKTGQTTVSEEGDDGDLQKGLPWPNPRFTDNADGTVSDNLTGLIWLKNASCTSFFSGDIAGQNNREWSLAITAANLLSNGYCGLLDGSVAGDWRLPNVHELVGLIHWGYWNPALPNTAGTGQCSQGNPFLNVVTAGSPFYYTSTTYPFSNTYLSGEVWTVPMSSGGIVNTQKTSKYYVWPVRDAR